VTHKLRINALSPNKRRSSFGSEISFDHFLELGKSENGSLKGNVVKLKMTTKINLQLPRRFKIYQINVLQN